MERDLPVNSMNAITNIHMDDLSSMVARKAMVNRTMILPFVDGVDTLSEILNLYDKPGVKLVTAGVATIDIAQAANRAEMDLVERLGSSAFAGDIRVALEGIMSARDVVYVANPNGVSGAHFSKSELEILARAVPQGLLLINEHYHDYFGITGTALLETSTNIIIVRSFTAPFSIVSSDSGYLMANPGTIKKLIGTLPPPRFSLTQRKTVLASLTNEKATSTRLQEVHDESLRMATALGKMRVPSRICATDFLLIQVSDPAQAGNHLATHKISIDNLDGYPQMKGYVRYRIQSPLSNDHFLRAFKTIPREYLRPARPDRSSTRLVGGAALRPCYATAKPATENDWAGQLRRSSVTTGKTESS